MKKSNNSNLNGFHQKHFSNQPSIAAVAVGLLISSFVSANAQTQDKSEADIQVIEIAAKKTRSTTSLSATDVQTLLPGTNPIKALQMLPGVNYQTADPWGNNEQNAQLFIHGFSTQQLGYTLDGIPLGDQQYGNYNGLSPQRAITSENVRSVILNSGAGDLGTASTSNLGGTIETYSSDPLKTRGSRIEQTLGSYSTNRTFYRYDTGTYGIDQSNSAYLSFMRLDAKAWDFEGHQGGKQINGKFIKNMSGDKFTAYFNYNDKIEPNEDSIARSATEKYQPYTRPFMYPNLASYVAYLDPKTSATPASVGNNYANYYSAAQRTDYLGYLKYDADLSNGMRWSNQVYFHNDKGAGLVAGPVGVAGLPGLFGVYFPNQNLKDVFGGSGIALRTTEYSINRSGLLSKFNLENADHRFEAGVWTERNESSAYRRWYAFNLNNPSNPTPYDKPTGNPMFTQYGSQIVNTVFQPYVQDAWQVKPNLTVQGGFKSSLQFATGDFPVQQKAGSISGGFPALPVGTINTKAMFLPQVGFAWDLSPKSQVFGNIQKNLRQFVTYGAGGLSPWSLSSQAAFDLFAKNAQPETAVTFEIGYRGSSKVEDSFITEVDGQINLYHVDFKDRLLQIASTPVINTINPGNPILANVGGVKTDGLDIGGTLRFGSRFSLYNALSYNQSTYTQDYTAGATGSVVATNGKQVPGSPQWLEKFVLTGQFGDIEAQLVGDFVGKRYATYLNDLWVDPYFITSMNITSKLPSLLGDSVKNSKLRLSITNLMDVKGDLNVGVGAVSGSYTTFPIAPRQFFLTYSGSF